MAFGLGEVLGTLVGQLTSGEGGKGKYQRVTDLYEQIAQPDFDFRSISPQELELVAEYLPETYEARVPEEVALGQDAPDVRSEQVRALEHLARIREEGLPVAERLAAQDQQQALQQAHRQATEAALSRLAERGRLGGGAEVAARMAAGQQSANLARGMGSDLAQQAIANRLAAIQASGGAAGALRAQDFGQSAQNAETINRFNFGVSQALTQARRDAAAARNQGRLYNVGTRQALADYNVENRQGTEEANLARQNALRQQAFQNRFAAASGQAGALGGQGDFEERRRQERIDLARMGGKAADQLGGFIAGQFF